MALTSDLISQFVKVTKDKTDGNKETTVFGTTVEYDGSIYVRLDGSDLLTPVTKTVNVKADERVTVMIKNHTATITGNMSSPAARTGDVDEVSSQITEFDIIVADRVTTTVMDAMDARFEELDVDAAEIQKLVAGNVEINQKLTAAEADIDELQTSKLDAGIAEITYATISELKTTKADIDYIESTYAEFESTTTQKLNTFEANIDTLQTEKLSVTDIEGKYANIDFSNISKSTMEWFYANSGLIENVVVSDGNITGRLVGVTIVGDSIEGNTIIADKLVIKGEDGLYYKLNTDGITTEAEQTEYNSLNGNVILAKSITATKIAVDDLVAFDATIGGFNITSDSIYSEVKDSEGNTTRGIYMDTDGQFNFGDGANYVKYYRDDEGNYKLVISAESILYALNGKQYSIADIGHLGDYVRIGAYEDEPCIELGENDSDFKLIITNTRILFMEGNDLPAYINNQSLHIKKAVIEEELQQGGFVWKIRSNGNMGLVWKGVSN